MKEIYDWSYRGISEEHIQKTANRVFSRLSSRLDWLDIEDVAQEIRRELLSHPTYSIYTVAQHVEKMYVSLALKNQPIDSPHVPDPEAHSFRRTFWTDVRRALSHVGKEREASVSPERQFGHIRGWYLEERPHADNSPYPVSNQLAHWVFNKALTELRKRKSTLIDYW